MLKTPITTCRICVLDGHTLNPGDLKWDALAELGLLDLFERTPESQTVERAMNAQIALTNKVIFDRPVLERLSRLRYIGVMATGYNVVDIDAARERAIVVTNVPAYSTSSVAQMVFALLFELTQRAGHHADTVRQGKWSRSKDFCYWDFPLIEIEGLTMGIYSLGRIGQAVAQRALAFGMKVIAVSHHPEDAPEGVELVDPETLFRQSDVLTLHCPFTPETKHLINAESLASMKPGAILINTSRGPVVDEAALATALLEGRLAGAGLDVLSQEPPAPDNPLLSAPNCLITPHIAWATSAARERLMRTVVENVRAFLDGRPQNVVNP
ncbi:D-2-hydroxyacid dehydrogenase [bacterium]|nr:D-2-hydroxyacid dehydrogenase [bacterium]